MVKRFKLIVAAIVALLVIIVIFQNVESVETRILFVEIKMPRALLLAITLATGFVLGVLFGSRLIDRIRGS